MKQYEMTGKRLAEMSAKYGRDDVIPIFCGTYHKVKNGFDIAKLPEAIAEAVHIARVREWHESDAEVARRYCSLLFVDPALIEAMIGMSFEEFCTHIPKREVMRALPNGDFEIIYR